MIGGLEYTFAFVHLLLRNAFSVKIKSQVLKVPADLTD